MRTVPALARGGSRVAKARFARQPARGAALELARTTDDGLVLKFATIARKKLGDAVLDDAARAPLASLCRQGARGLIPHAAWEAAIAEAVPTPRIMSFEGEAKRHAWSALLAALREALPSSAHEQRIRRALATLSRSAPCASDQNAGLCALMEGALASGSSALQQELLARFRGLAAERSVPLVQLVQAPLLEALGADEAAALRSMRELAHDPCAASVPFRPIDPIACLLTAAQCARRDALVKAPHGCVLIEHPPSGQSDGGEGGEADLPGSIEGGGVAHGAVGRLLGLGWNHHVKAAGRDQRRRNVLIHAEVHALADAISRRGEVGAFEAFPRSTLWIVELAGGVGYDASHPCITCEGMLRAVGLGRVCHTASDGTFHSRVMGPPLRRARESGDGPLDPLRIVLREEFGVVCEERLGRQGPRHGHGRVV